jgi:hypothetical protein
MKGAKQRSGRECVRLASEILSVGTGTAGLVSSSALAQVIVPVGCGSYSGLPVPSGCNLVDYSAGGPLGASGAPFTVPPGVDQFVLLSSFDDYVETSADRQIICTLWGNDEVHAGGGDDQLIGSLGNDAMYGAGGNDTISGDQGDDLVDRVRATMASLAIRATTSFAVGAATTGWSATRTTTSCGERRGGITSAAALEMICSTEMIR